MNDMHFINYFLLDILCVSLLLFIVYYLFFPKPQEVIGISKDNSLLLRGIAGLFIVFGHISQSVVSPSLIEKIFIQYSHLNVGLFFFFKHMLNFTL